MIKNFIAGRHKKNLKFVQSESIMESENKLNYHIENIQPILSVKDMGESKAFYIDLLGFTEAGWGDDNFTSVNRNSSGIYLCKGAQGNPGTWLWIGFDGDIFALHDQLKSKGVKILQPPINYSWAMEIHVEDPDGHVLRFGTDPDNHEPYLDKKI